MAIPFGHALSKLRELLKDLTKNLVSDGAMDSQTPLGVMVNLAGSQTTQAAQPTVVEFVRGQFNFQSHGNILHQGLHPLLVQCRFPASLAPSIRCNGDSREDC